MKLITVETQNVSWHITRLNICIILIDISSNFVRNLFQNANMETIVLFLIMNRILRRHLFINWSLIRKDSKSLASPWLTRVNKKLCPRGNFILFTSRLNGVLLLMNTIKLSVSMHITGKISEENPIFLITTLSYSVNNGKLAILSQSMKTAAPCKHTVQNLTAGKNKCSTPWCTKQCLAPTCNLTKANTCLTINIVVTITAQTLTNCNLYCAERNRKIRNHLKLTQT